jgi:hypothetical protein
MVVLKKALLCLTILALSCGNVFADALITIDYVVRSERIRPSPKIITAPGTYKIELHTNGTVSETYQNNLARGPTREQRLGRGNYTIVDQHTIRRTFYYGQLKSIATISVHGQSCTANVQFQMPPGSKTEYKTYSRSLGAEAYFRKPSLKQVSCSIH